MSDCYYDAAGCLVCPEQPEVAASPGYFTERPIVGWNAGANSVAQLDGDFHLVTDIPAVVGVVMGLKTSRARQTQTSLIEHGYAFGGGATAPLYKVVERGADKTMFTARSLSALFEIRRVAGVVYYYVDSALVYTSTERSYGPKIVNVCLYSSGDEVPS